jgi:hypothetical protein
MMVPCGLVNSCGWTLTRASATSDKVLIKEGGLWVDLIRAKVSHVGLY